MGVIHPKLSGLSGQNGGEPDGFSALYRRQFGFVWSLTAHFGVPPAAREDVAQEVWLTVHRRLDTLRDDASPRAWVASITRRVASRHHRSQQRAQRKLAALEAIEHTGDDGSFGPDAFALVGAALDRMDPAQREVFMLTQVEELSGPEVAEILEISVNTVYSRLRLARARLAEALAELEQDERALVESLREPPPSKRVSARLWFVITAELGTRTAATLVGGLGTKLAAAIASGVAVIAIGTATASAVQSDPPQTDAVVVAAAALPMPEAAPAPAPADCEQPPAPELALVLAATEETPTLAPAPAPKPARARAAQPEVAPPPVAPAPADPTPTLDPEEGKLLTQAKLAFKANDAAGTLRILATMKQRFPNGLLAGDRRALLVRAMCASGDVLGARAEAKRLQVDHPNTSAAVGVQDVCTTP